MTDDQDEADDDPDNLYGSSMQDEPEMQNKRIQHKPVSSKDYVFYYISKMPNTRGLRESNYRNHNVQNVKVAFLKEQSLRSYCGLP